MQSFTVSSTKRQQIIDINSQVEDIISSSGTANGICVVYVPHATAAVLVNENYDPNVMLDIIDAVSAIAPEGKWRHDRIDGNADAHIKSALIGPSETLIIREGKPVLGRWQDIMIADFDGPKKRKVYVKIINR